MNSEFLLTLFFNGLVVGSIYTLIALGLTLVFGLWEIPNFAHGNIYMIGAYLSLFSILMFNNFFAGSMLAILMTTVIGVTYYVVLIRPLRLRNSPEISLLLNIIGFFFLLFGIALLVWGPFARTIPPPLTGRLEILGTTISYGKIVVLIVTPLLIGMLILFIYKTKAGKSIRAASQNLERAITVGINIDKVYLLTFGIASALAAVAGVLIGCIPGQSVEPEMGFIPLLYAFVAVVLGGLGSIGGAIFGGYILGLTRSFGIGLTGGYLPFIGKGYAEVYALIIFMIVLLIKPTGFFGRRLR